MKQVRSLPSQGTLLACVLSGLIGFVRLARCCQAQNKRPTSALEREACAQERNQQTTHAVSSKDVKSSTRARAAAVALYSTGSELPLWGFSWRTAEEFWKPTGTLTCLQSGWHANWFEVSQSNEECTFVTFRVSFFSSGSSGSSSSSASGSAASVPTAR